MTRILAFDISASPGVAVIELRYPRKSGKTLIKCAKPFLLYVDSVKTDTKNSDAQRYAYIEAFAVKAIHEYGPFDVVVREKYTGSSRSKRAKQLVYGAWAAIDMALGKYGYAIEEKDGEIVASAIKKAVAGNGSADKEEVADGVRRILGEDITFKSDDASDAVAVALTWAIREGRIEV